MNIIGIIPARMGSSRFPGKPLAKILDVPMIGHCYYRTTLCKELITTYVATCDQEIADYMNSINGNVVMTSPHHQRATDRTAEAMLLIEKQIKKQIDVIVMIQGDEPMVTPNMISAAVTPFKQNPSIQIVNLMSSILTMAEFEDPNEVKVVVDKNNNALYFSREAIPSRKKGINHVPMLKQVCIIPFRRHFLLQFNQWEETPLERIESVDMLRILENGGRIQMINSPNESYSVDTPQDLEFVTEKMKTDHLVHFYKERLKYVVKRVS